MKSTLAVFVAVALAGSAGLAAASPQDENLASSVHVALLTADAVDGTLITVRADDGVVTLDGIVASEDAKKTAEQLARDVAGVSQIRNELTVDTASSAQAQVAQDLAKPDVPHDAGMAPGVQHGVQHGAQAGAAAIGAAGAMAGAAAKDGSSAECIGARYRSRLLGQPMAQAQAAIDDEELTRRVTKALDNDPLLENSEIRVTRAENGKVRLEGRAQSIPVHRHALLTAFHVPGVCRVASNITSPADAAAAAVAPDAENAEAAASTEGAGNDPTEAGSLPGAGGTEQPLED